MGGAQLDDLAGLRVLDHLLAADHAGVAQAHLAPGGEAVVVARRVLHEVVAIDVDDAPHGHDPRALLGDVDRPRGRVDLVDLALGPGLDDHAQRPEHGQHPRRAQVEILPQHVLEQGELDGAVVLGDADALAEIADGVGGVAAAAQPREGGEARVVPAGDVLSLHELQQLALAGQHRGHLEPGELVLVGPPSQAQPGLLRVGVHRRVGGEQLRHPDRLDDPVVELAVVLELERADGVGDALDQVGEAVGEVVEGIDAPGVAGAVVVGVADAVERPVAHLEVGARHVDLGAQHVGAVGELALAHAGEEVEVLRHGPVPVGAGDARLEGGAAVLADVVLAEAADVGFPGADEADGVRVEPLVVVGGEEELVRPVEAEPAHVALDRLHVLEVLGRGVGVVEAQVAGAPVVAGEAEVQADRLGVAEVQVAVGLGGEAGDDASAPPGREVPVHDVTDEIGRLRRGRPLARALVARHARSPVGPGNLRHGGRSRDNRRVRRPGKARPGRGSRGGRGRRLAH